MRVCNRPAPTHLLDGEHSPVGQRHLAARRLASEPAKVHSPCSQVGGRCLPALTAGACRRGPKASTGRGYERGDLGVAAGQPVGLTAPDLLFRVSLESPRAPDATSPQLGGRPPTLGAQPFDHLAGPLGLGDVERRAVVPADPVEVGATVAQVLGGLALPTVAGLPEGVGDLVGSGRVGAREAFLDPVQEAERPACQSVVRAPRSRSRRAARHCPNPTASARGVPPPSTAPGASTSAPASTRASRTSTSSLLAAQCSGVSACGPTNGAFTSAPASTSAATTAGPLGKWPGQSVATCSSVRASPSSPRWAAARSWCSRSTRRRAARSPVWIASVTATARGASVASVDIVGSSQADVVDQLG